MNPSRTQSSRPFISIFPAFTAAANHRWRTFLSLNPIQSIDQPKEFKMRLVLTVVLAVLVSSAAQAQMHQHQPYAGMEPRSIKALSDQQIADLRDGRGMSLALAAELNGYPEPSHVL